MKITKCPQPLNSLTQSSFINQQPIIQGHILKFIKKGNTFKQKGIICFPQQTYGTSEQSPQQFKLANTLKPKHGYVYDHQNKAQFKYYSQKRYFSIDGSLNEDDSKNIHSEDPENQFKFHRKKGRLTEWMDKNGWMNKTTKMMGFERSDKARDFSNRDRLKRIQALKPKINYDNIAAIKPDTKGQYFKTIGTLTSRKMKIRSNRNIQSEKFSQSVEARNIQSSRRAVSRQDRETVQRKMLQTAREWSPSRTAKLKCDEFTKTFFQNRLPKFENQINDQKASRQFSWRQDCEQTLEEWYRTTCSSKWVYNKKLDSQEMELD